MFRFLFYFFKCGLLHSAAVLDCKNQIDFKNVEVFNLYLVMFSYCAENVTPAKNSPKFARK